MTNAKQPMLIVVIYFSKKKYVYINVQSNPLQSLSAQQVTTSLNIIHVYLHLCRNHSLFSLMQSQSLLSEQDHESCYMDQGPFSATKAS